jgi:methyltransferase
MWALGMVAFVVVAFLLIESARAARNQRAQIARGGVEPPGDVYKMMRIAYPGAFLAMFAEGFFRESTAQTFFIAGALTFASAKALKWWAISALGPAWTFRVVVVPGAPLVTAGPYRWLRHPNYVAVAGELGGVALMSGARITGPIAIVAFSLLMLRRIAVENRALGAILRRVELSTTVDAEETEETTN